MTDQAELVPTDKERDSLHILPLCIVPLETPGLRRARLVKNNRIETMIELFKASGSGSGQVTLRDLPGFFPTANEAAFKSDIHKIGALARIPSFDVYSCRISLRALGIQVDEHTHLQLSDTKKSELTERMKAFTAPLIKNVYGQDTKDVADAGDLSAMLRNPDKEEALRRLTMLAEKLNVSLEDIPRFVEDYGDVFLSLAFFQDKLDEVVPTLNTFLGWVADLRQSWQVRNDRSQDRILDTIVADLSDISGSITGRFESFERKTQDFWTDISAERFKEVRDLVTAHHVTVGGVLCGLTLKLDLWQERFPDRNSGGPQQRIEFCISEIMPGLDHIKRLEARAAKSGN
ncbi:hypothetical protein KAJ83_07005 [Marivibrio halodurans]|uniref:Uncharacterized protein n=1 Tax=Marivibrio halodurans TaxID=2039722 RepID=A0A8J7V238_9PROT|nr:hypothetical protein [Marivibrio halodurans]MBP5856751.1 hypothetical protein [Marivibrio halodurans]